MLTKIKSVCSARMYQNVKKKFWVLNPFLKQDFFLFEDLKSSAI